MKSEPKRYIRAMGIILFALYILLLIYFLFFSESYGRTIPEEQGYRYNLVPFKEIKRFWQYRETIGYFGVITNLAGNVIGFVPFGFILPIIQRNTRTLFFIGFSGFSLSLSVECIQLIFKVGIFDVDDLILNTAGAILGYLMFVVCYRIYGKARG